jgi:hypothetical protein
MSKVARFLTMSGVAAALAGAASLGAQNPVPPVKVGLWQTQMSQLDANGKEVPSPEVAAFAKMAPAVRAQMAEMMRSRGMQMPDENGVMKTCLTRETLDSPAWQQMAADTGCTTTYSARSNSVWKWHSTCPSMKSESDGETTFTGSEAYRTRLTSTVTVNGKTTTSTRVVQGKWLGAACGDVKPFAPPAAPGRGR